jgi:hypothetical protein
LNRNEAGITRTESVVPASFCVNTLEDAEVHINSILINMEQQAARIRQVEKLLDVWDSPWWKIALFVIDGWPLKRVVKKPQWRPWHGWWVS